jgi:cytochrome c-type biogenesis protein
MEVTVSLPLAFLAGLVSFLSPCVLPVVPGCIVFVSGLTLEQLREGTIRGARLAAVLHSLVFVAGFTAVFVSIGWAATSAGQAFARALPWISRIGGLALILFGLYLLGFLRWPALERDLRVHVARRGAGPLGSFLAGVAFGAGWTPCIGPILASILLYVSLEGTHAQGVALLATYAAGLGLPFVVASISINGFLAGARYASRGTRGLQKMAGATLVLVGVLMATGTYASLTEFLAGFGQYIDLEMP